MPARLFRLDDLTRLSNPKEIASLFQRLGYNAEAQPLAIDDLELPARSAEAIWNAHLIANQSKGAESLQVLLFHLQEGEFASPSIASGRLRAIAQSLSRRPSNYLLLGTRDYNQLMLVNPRVNGDNLKVSIRKLLIDRNNPTPYDRDRLEAIAVNGQSPNTLYKTHCEAFDVDKLTKEFYKGYKKLFDRVQGVVGQHNPCPYFEDLERLHQFCQRLLGRVMFLYFLQKKEFLGGDRSFLKNQYKRLKPDLEDTEFYDQILEPLFFDTLNRQRPRFESPWGQIPYLNGGLFDKDYGTDVIDAAGQATPERIIIPNGLFDPGEPSSILGFFNSYNFTVSENTPGDEDVAVDPEMLGKVFENMLATEERGQSGTFYTPRGIVQFMCTEVLCRYLADETGMDLEVVRKIVDYDPELPNTEFNKLMAPQQARKLKQAVYCLKCLDPAVGSGAFPLGMMQAILNVKQAIARREGMTVQRGSLTISQWKRDIIANNLYGVDIKPEAIEIAKLRMWLSLVVDIPNIEDVEPLPNLDYKLMCGDSLISTIHGEQLIPDPNKDKLQLGLNVTPIQQAIAPLLDLQHRYFNAQTEERHELRKQILDAEANVFRVAVAGRKNALLEELRLTGTPSSKEYQGLAGKRQKAQIKKYQKLQARLAELDKFATKVAGGERSLNFFQYHLHFRDVFESNGGFDIVIGNPPYGLVFNENIKNDYELNYPVFKRNNDIYAAFYQQGLFLLKNQGNFSYISPNTFLNGDYFEELRKFITEKAKINNVVDYKNIKVFDDPTVFVCVVSFTKLNQIDFPYDYQILTAKDTINNCNKTLSTIKNLSSFAFKEEDKIFIRLNNPNEFILLDDLFLVKDVGFNYWTQGGGKKRGENSIGKRVFYKGKQQHILDIPFLKGSNLQKWHHSNPNNYLKHNYQELLTSEFDTFRFSSGLLEQNPKIIYRQTASNIIATIDKNKLYLDKTVHLIVSRESWDYISPYVLLGILNSKLMAYLYTYISQENSGRAFPQVKTTYIKKMPIPKNLNPKDENLVHITNLVQKCLNSEGLGVEEWEAEIDDRVAHLYGLTNEEMKIIKEV